MKSVGAEFMRRRMLVVMLIWSFCLFGGTVWMALLMLTGWKPWSMVSGNFNELAERQQWNEVNVTTNGPVFLDRNGYAMNHISRVFEVLPAQCAMPSWTNRVVKETAITVARPVIGVATKDAGGVVGLEKSLDRDIRTPFAYVPKIRWTMNATGNTCETSYINAGAPYYPLHVQTTIDRSIQEDIEQILNNFRVKKGAVVILDMRTADVIVMASRPVWRISPQSWRNTALEAVAPGSIFKLVTWLAMAQQVDRIPKQEVKCTGHGDRINGVRCWSEAGHGQMNGLEALVQSCNAWFAGNAKDVSMIQLKTIARRLGLFQRIGSEGQWSGEQSGDFAIGADDMYERAQSMIGQRNVRMTPLQAANLMVTIWNEGKVATPRVVTAITDARGMVRKQFPVKWLSGIRVGLPVEYAALKVALRNTVERGTGKILHNSVLGVAGKTGTAQNTNTEHQWFIGYTPADAPKYAFAVVIEDLSPNLSSQVLPLTKEIVTRMSKNKM